MISSEVHIPWKRVPCCLCGALAQHVVEKIDNGVTMGKSFPHCRQDAQRPGPSGGAGLFRNQNSGMCVDGGGKYAIIISNSKFFASV